MKKTERKRKVPRVTFETTGPSRAKQSFKDECDINGIMRRFEKTGLLEHANEYAGSYGDFTDVPQDYQAAINQVMAAEQMFMTVPAKIRARFANDPGQFLAFVGDPANGDELVRMGLADPRPAPDAPKDTTGDPASGVS